MIVTLPRKIVKAWLNTRESMDEVSPHIQTAVVQRRYFITDELIGEKLLPDFSSFGTLSARTGAQKLCQKLAYSTPIWTSRD